MSCVVVWCVWWDTAFINIGSNFPFKDQADMASVATEPQASIKIEFALNSEYTRIVKDETLCMHVLRTTCLLDGKTCASQAPLTVEIKNLKDTVPGYPVKVRIVPAFSDKLLVAFSAGYCYDGEVGKGYPDSDGETKIKIDDEIKSFDAPIQPKSGELAKYLKEVSEELVLIEKSLSEFISNGADGPLTKQIVSMKREERGGTDILNAIQYTLLQCEQLTRTHAPFAHSLEPCTSALSPPHLPVRVLACFVYFCVFNLSGMEGNESKIPQDTLYCHAYVHKVALESVKASLHYAIAESKAPDQQENYENEHNSLREQYKNLPTYHKEEKKRLTEAIKRVKPMSEFAKRHRMLAVASAFTVYKKYKDAAKLEGKPSIWWVSQALIISQGANCCLELYKTRQNTT